MKIVLLLAILGLGTAARAGILAGPVVNPGNGHTYYLLSQSTWSKAEAEAIGLGGHLATIRNSGEDRWVYNTFGRYGGAMWIGLADREKQFTFKWVSGESSTYTNWGGGQPDHGIGTDKLEYFTHIWPPGHTSPPSGQWNDYADLDTVLGFPLFGVAEVSPISTVQLSLNTPSKESSPIAVANVSSKTTAGPQLHAFTAIELSWPSELNRFYQIQWTPSLDEPKWVNLEPKVLGNGASVSFFDSTREHPNGFYRVQIAP